MTEPDYEPDMTPSDYYEDCDHACVCRMQWEREHGEFDDYMFAATDELARCLGCGEECDFFEGWALPKSLSGTMRPAKRVIEGDGVVGRCTCSACHGSIGVHDKYCKHCGLELS